AAAAAVHRVGAGERHLAAVGELVAVAIDEARIAGAGAAAADACGHGDVIRRAGEAAAAAARDVGNDGGGAHHAARLDGQRLRRAWARVAERACFDWDRAYIFTDAFDGHDRGGVEGARAGLQRAARAPRRAVARKDD